MANTTLPSQTNACHLLCYLVAYFIDLGSDSPVAVGGLPTLNPLLGRVHAGEIGKAEVGVFMRRAATGAGAVALAERP